MGALAVPRPRLIDLGRFDPWRLLKPLRMFDGQWFPKQRIQFEGGPNKVGGPISIVDDGTDTFSSETSGVMTWTGRTSAGPHTAVLLSWRSETGEGSIDSALWGGVAADQIYFENDPSATPRAGAGILIFSGAMTGNLVVTMTQGIAASAYATFVRLNNLVSTTPVATNNARGTGASISLTVSTPGDGGIRLYAFANRAETTAVSWTNATEFSGADVNANEHRHSAAYALGDSGSSVTADGGTHSQVLVGGAWR